MSDARNQRRVLARTVVIALLSAAACGHGNGGHLATRDTVSTAATTTAPSPTTTTVPDYGAIYSALAKQTAATTTVAPGPRVHTITAVLYLRSATADPGMTFGEGKHCVGAAPDYSDISDTTQAIVRDGSGRTIGTTLIGPGVVQHGVCTYHFAFRDVPEVSSYTFQLSHRAGPSRSLAALQASNWAISLLFRVG